MSGYTSDSTKRLNARRSRGDWSGSNLPVTTLFTVGHEDLARLDPRAAVDFFGDLLWAESRRIGLPTSRIRVSSRIYVADGGVDAAVEGDLPEPSDILKNDRTSFQIKGRHPRCLLRGWSCSPKQETNRDSHEKAQSLV